MNNVHTLKRLLFCVACFLIPHVASATQMDRLGDQAQIVDLQTASNQSFSAYIAGPQDASQAILLIHGWWGLDDEIKSWSNEFAVAGYRVMAIDLYDHQVTHNPAMAKKLMKSVKQSDADDKYAAAIKALSVPGRKIAVIGRSYGASQALHAAQVAKEKVAAAIVYYPYGELMTDRKMLNNIRAPILGHFARDDFFLKPDQVNEFASVLKKAGLNMTVNMYEARHGFDKPGSSNFSEPAHKQAQQKTRQFLNRYLN